MNLGHILLTLALVAGAVGLALRMPALRDTQKRWLRLERYGAYAVLTQCALVIAALVLLTAYFLLGDLRTEYVWSHTDVNYPWYYKLAGIWGGQKGTILLWTGLLALFLGVEARRSLQPDEAPPLRAPRRWVIATLAALVLAFTGYMLVDAMFEPTPAHLLEIQTTREGRGLQESLVTPLMVIHPPLQFVAYALVALPTAWALGGWAATRAGQNPKEARAWVTPALKWSRPAWLFATIGLGLGGLWAYYVLNFGGYWAWDPVETANLMPWLALTAFMHAGRHLEKFGDFPIAAPVLAVLGTWLVAFASFATRSGLWVSVHAFTDPTNQFNPDAAGRLLAIMDVSLATRFLVGVLIATAFVAAALLVRSEATRVRLGPVGRRAADAYAILALLVGGVGAAAPTAFLGASFELGHRIPVIDHAGYGTALLWLTLLGGPILLLYLRDEAPDTTGGTPGTGDSWRAWLGTRRLMAASVTLFSIALAVTILLDFQVVNGFDRTVFDARAPFVALPIVSVLTLLLAKEPLGPKGAVGLAGGGLVAGVAAAFVFPDDLVVAVSTPVLLAALVGGVAKIVHVNRGGPAPRPLKVAGTLLLLGSLLGLVMWSNPPTHQPLGPFTLTTGPLVGGIFWTLGFIGFLGALSTLRAGSLPLSVAGATGTILAAGYAVGSLLGIAALVLILRHAGAYPTRMGAFGFFRKEAGRLSRTGVWVIHLAVIIGLLGYAASTYAQDRAAFRIEPGEVDSVNEWSFELVGSEGEEAATGGWYETVAADVLVKRHGKEAYRGELEFYYREPPIGHYDPRLDIQRGFVRDLYLSPLTLTVEGQPTIQAHGDSCAPTGTGACFRSDEVREVTFEVTVLPLITLVWAGLWLMGAGMLMVLAGAAGMARTRRRTGAARQAKGSPSTHPTAQARR